MKYASLAVGSLPFGLADMAERQGMVSLVGSRTTERDMRALLIRMFKLWLFT